ncbi:hypothetical protein [Nonomuraea sp. NPDC049480]|uniref:hypothetical protein n=1 Tax=Nonomuraea sp. NPDC049480 TaxID=3364353 RepID=UPI0037A419C1
MEVHCLFGQVVYWIGPFAELLHDPGDLLEAGFAFDYPQWPEAADDLVRRLRGGPRSAM